MKVIVVNFVGWSGLMCVCLIDIFENGKLGW